MQWTRRQFCQTAIATAYSSSLAALGQGDMPSASAHSIRLLEPHGQLNRWIFWTNRDWDWYEANLPFWESPDQSIDEIYYYRAELLTKHLRYASPETGYVFTEFSNADPLSWAGRYNVIASATDLQLEEIRWLKTRQYGQDYCRYWMQTEGAQPRNYGFAAAWACWQMGLVHGDQSAASALLDKYVENYKGWERGRTDYPHNHGYDPERALFWNTGRDMGGEFNLASCQLSESLRNIAGYKIRGGAGYRPDINAVLYAEAATIVRLASLAGRTGLAETFSQKAATLRQNTQRDLWDDQRQFFLHRWRYDEFSEGDTPEEKSIRQWSLIWETNSDRNGGVGYQPEIAGKSHGRELTGYIPWRYGLPADEQRFAEAWQFLLSENYFDAPFGPTTAERHDPWFHVVYHACRHNGQSWPFHTARILSAAARLLNDYQYHGALTRERYFELFARFARSHYKNGRPHLAEALNPFNGEWVQDEWPGLDYFHSSYIDHVITGIAGLRPGDTEEIVVNPLAPESWDYFALDRVAYRNHTVSILWDRTGERYGRGKGLRVFVDGRCVASSERLERLRAPLPAARSVHEPYEVILSANCEGAAFPKAEASFTAKYDSPQAALDGLCWYDPQYGDKWTCRGSWAAEDWFQIDFGSEKTIQAVRLCLYADQQEVAAPLSYSILTEQAGSWLPVQAQSVHPPQPEANRANTVRFAPLSTRRVRILFRHKPGIGVGLAQAQVM